MITREEERELIRRFQEEGDESARAKLVEAHLPQIKKMALRLHRKCRFMELDDLIQIGALTLHERLSHFDPRVGTSVMQCYGMAIYGEMQRAISTQRLVRTPRISALSDENKRLAHQTFTPCDLEVVSATPEGERKTNLADELVFREFKERRHNDRIDALLDDAEIGLTEAQREVFRQIRYGTRQAEVARRMGLSESRVSQLLTQGIAFIRKRLGVVVEEPRAQAWKSRMAERMKARRAQDQV